jgi:hypothetical protein
MGPNLPGLVFFFSGQGIHPVIEFSCRKLIWHFRLYLHMEVSGIMIAGTPREASSGRPIHAARIVIDMPECYKASHERESSGVSLKYPREVHDIDDICKDPGVKPWYV